MLSVEKWCHEQPRRLRQRRLLLLNHSQGPVGAVLGEVTSANSGTATAGVGNTGDATISTVAVSNDAITGTYSVLVIAVATPAAFTVTGPGGATANGSMG